MVLTATKTSTKDHVMSACQYITRMVYATTIRCAAARPSHRTICPIERSLILTNASVTKRRRDVLERRAGVES